MFHHLIASDLDGTLLPEGRRALNPALFPLIRRLRQKGVLFCPASGRAYDSLLALFAEVANEIVFMPENGALAYAEGKLLYHVSMPRELCRQLVSELQKRSDCYARVNTTVGCYMLRSPVEQAQRLPEAEDASAQEAQSFDEILGEITKVTAVSPGPIEAPAAVLLPAWQERIGAAVTGEHWLDFTSAGKDVGLRRLCETFGVPLENTIAFGDNFNDVPMLETAGTAYLMENACAELKARFAHRTDSVLKTLCALEPLLAKTV